MKRKEKDGFLKARIIISSILLAVILGGWLIYGIHATYSNPRLVLQKFLKSEEKNIYDKISNFKVDNTSNGYAGIFNKDIDAVKIK